jgi:hypothetical protein
MPDPGGATPPLDEAGCQEFLDFLETLAGRGRSAVLITSRASEDWLGGTRRIAVGGPGLARGHRVRGGTPGVLPGGGAPAGDERGGFAGARR